MHTLPDLPYDYKALEPIIDEQTMRIHHDKHHAAYVDNLNKALADFPDLQEKTIEELLADLTQVPEKIRQAVINHGGGHYNHSLFWNMMTGEKEQAPSSQLASAIDTTFGSMDSFKEKFGQAGMARFGSGWAWLVVKDGALDILSTANQDTPLSQGYTPILGLDIWEHAYYLTYQNRRAEYIESWWNIVHWNFVSKEFSRVS